MATLTFDRINRHIIIEAPATNVLVQEIYDKAQEWANRPDNLREKKVVEAVGKFDLGGGEYTGVAMRLLDWKIKFADRGSFELCQVSGGDTVAVDDVGALSDPIAQSVNTFVIIRQSTAPAAIATGGLLNQADVDALAAGVMLEPLVGYTTEGQFGDVQRRKAFEDASVWIAPGSGFSGTTFPTGTPGKPVDNPTDAKTIADAHGLKRFMFLMGNGNAINLPALDYYGYEFVSAIPGQQRIICQARDYDDCTFVDSLFSTGASDATGAVTLLRGSISTVFIATITCIETSLTGTIKVPSAAGQATINLQRCSAPLGGGTFGAIDCNNKRAVVLARQCSGFFTLKNIVAGSAAYMGLTDGQVTIDSSCTGGTIEISGSCEIVDNSTGSTVNDKTEKTLLLTEPLVGYTTEGQLADVERRKAFENSAVWLSSVSGVSGTAFPIGTPGKPSSSFADAKTIADANGLRRFMVQGFFFLPAQDLTNCEFVSIPKDQAVIILASQSYVGSSFENFILSTTSNMASGQPVFTSCAVTSVNLDAGVFRECEFVGTLKSLAIGFAPPAIFVINRCQARILTDGIIDCDGIHTTVIARQCSGIWTIRNCTHANSVIEMGMTDGEIIIESSCTAGTINITGSCAVVDNSTGATVNDKTTQTNVWLEQIQQHAVVAGSAANFMVRKLLTLAKWIGLR